MKVYSMNQPPLNDTIYYPHLRQNPVSSEDTRDLLQSYTEVTAMSFFVSETHSGTPGAFMVFKSFTYPQGL